MSTTKGLGSRQLIHAVNHASSAKEDDRSALAERLLLAMGWGLLSANCARWIAEGGVIDTKIKPQVVQLSNIGCGGVYAGNCRRDLLSTFCKKMTVPDPSMWLYQLRIMA